MHHGAATADLLHPVHHTGHVASHLGVVKVLAESHGIIAIGQAWGGWGRREITPRVEQT